MKRNYLVLITTLLASFLFGAAALAQANKESSSPKQSPPSQKEDKGKATTSASLAFSPDKGNKGNSGAPANERTSDAKLKITISSVSKEDANAKNVPAGRLIPVRFVWLCGSTGNAKLVELEARLITLNNDGKQTTVNKKLVDWKVNTPITSVIELPMAKDVFAKNFTLELVGKFTDGKVEHAVSASKQGNFPVPNPVEQKR